jgi:hypothetical protein
MGVYELFVNTKKTFDLVETIKILVEFTTPMVLARLIKSILT